MSESLDLAYAGVSNMSFYQIDDFMQCLKTWRRELFGGGSRVGERNCTEPNEPDLQKSMMLST